MIGGRSALLSAAGGSAYHGNWTGNYEDVSLLLRNGAPAWVPVDESPRPKDLTASGNAGISTVIKQYGTSSMVFDGSGDYFGSPLNADFDFGTGDFTIECWVNFNTLATNQTFVSYAAGTSTGSVVSFGLERLSSGSFRCFIHSGTPFYVATVNPVISTGTWYHVAGVRSGGQLRCYVNGVGGTAVNANASPNVPAGRVLTVGSYFTSSRFTNGYIDDLRITKGVARYTANFTPPTVELPANTTDDPSYNNVSLLLRNGAPIGPFVPVDESPTPKTITTFGDASITTTVVKYGTSAMAFDGSGDCFICPASSFVGTNTETFTIEFWAYWGSTTTSQKSLISNYINSSFGFIIQQISGTYRIGVNLSGDAFDIVGTDSFLLNAWNHIALCGTPGSTGISLFLNGVQQGSAYTGAVNLGSTTADIYIGGIGALNTAYFNGYIDDLRITKSVARYTKNFTPPPAELPAI